MPPPNSKTHRSLLGRLARQGLALALTATCLTVHAGNLLINPIRLDFNAREREAVITVRNLDSQPSIVQVRAVRWTIRDNAEAYEPTNDFIAAPLIFTVPPEKEQVLRIGLRADAPRDVEDSYRVFFTEVPVPEETSERSAIRMLLNVGVPVFVRPATAVAPQVTWRLERLDKGLRLVVANDGTAHARVTRLRIADPAGVALLDTELNVYVLPGSRRWWDLPVAAAARQLSVEATLDGNTSTQNFDVPAR